MPRWHRMPSAGRLIARGASPPMVEFHHPLVAKTPPDWPRDPKRFVFAHNNLMSALIIMCWRDPHSERPANAPIGVTSVVWATDPVEIYGILLASWYVLGN